MDNPTEQKNNAATAETTGGMEGKAVTATELDEVGAIKRCAQNLWECREHIAELMPDNKEALKSIGSAIEALEGIAGKNSWKYVEKDGNPTEPGNYLVALVFPKYITGESRVDIPAEASIEMRYFGDLDSEPGLINWLMEGEPEEGMVWTEECGSRWHEKVYAWRPILKAARPRLPKGIVWEDVAIDAEDSLDC